MNISPDGYTIRFKTENESLFEAEKSGAKSNTVRVLSYYEADQIKHKPPTKIIIQHQQEVFLRTITDIHIDYNFGKVLTTFSWTNDDHHHTIDNNKEQDEYRHIQSLDPLEEPPLKSQAINISIDLRKRLDLCRGEETYDEFISKLLTDYKTPPHQHTIPQDWNWSYEESRKQHTIALDTFLREPIRSKTASTTEEEEEEDTKLALIGISKGMSNILVRLTYNRSMDAVIREMYEIYLAKLAEERGPMHD